MTTRPHHSAGTRNAGHQDALRQAMTRVAQEAFPTAELQASPLGKLFIAIQTCANAMRPADSPDHLLREIGYLVDRTTELEEAGFQSEGDPKKDQLAAVWAALLELRAVYERDKPFIELADRTARSVGAAQA